MENWLEKIELSFWKICKTLIYLKLPHGSYHANITNKIKKIAVLVEKYDRIGHIPVPNKNKNHFNMKINIWCHCAKTY